MSGKKKTLRSQLINASAALNIIAISLMLGFGAVYLLFFEHETIADDENRYLAEFPEFSLDSYLTGDYTEGIAEYFNDTVHGRAEIKKLIASKIMPLKGRAYGNDEEAVELYGIAFEHDTAANSAAATTTVTASTTTVTSASADPGISTELTTTTVSAAVTETTTLPAPQNDDNDAGADGEIANNILVVNKRGITLYGGGWGNEKEYASFLNAYKKALPDVNVYSMVLPTACSYYLPDKYKNLAASEENDLKSIAGSLEDVTPIDTYLTMLMHSAEDIYSRTDHHWQPLGAYYAAEEFARTAGVSFTGLDKYEKVVLHDYVGTLYGYTQSAALLNNPEDFIYYKPQNSYSVTQYDTHFKNPFSTSLFVDPSFLSTSSYYLVFGMDDRIVHVHTDCNNGRKLVIFKDSYGNALLPFLTGSFEDIYLCDIRYFDLNAADFIKEVGATDLLFAMCSYSAVGVNRTHIYENLYK